MEKERTSKPATGYVVTGVGALFVLLALYGLITVNLPALIFWGAIGITLLLVGIQQIRRNTNRA